MNIYNSLPEGVVGATGYGLIGKMFFGKSVGGLIFALKMLDPYFKQLPKWAQEFSVMLGGGIPPSFFKEVPKGAPKVTMPMPPYPKAPGPDRSGWGEPSFDYMEMETQLTSDLYAEMLGRGEQMLQLDMVQAELLA